MAGQSCWLGDDDWPFPAPLVRRAIAGFSMRLPGARKSSTDVSVATNWTIQTLLAIVDAQREYAADDLDGNGSNDYARRFVSSEGNARWSLLAGRGRRAAKPAGAAGWRSDARRLRRKAAGNGPAAAYHGYRYRMLTAQGKDAAGRRLRLSGQ
jgi:hypothetical protein